MFSSSALYSISYFITAQRHRALQHVTSRLGSLSLSLSKSHKGTAASPSLSLSISHKFTTLDRHSHTLGSDSSPFANSRQRTSAANFGGDAFNRDLGRSCRISVKSTVALAHLPPLHGFMLEAQPQSNQELYLIT
ncbi:uncharacterized protein LOC109712689 [Ananas comosus]|uniref:Uncharacterized protein LOC109712689 n=1 Tax=Ananas comosus TaxID=4615 RepID=A0A6P5F8R7_ANACO|nr:uncharacterized protein LOC109712689 [Ananas comosus]